MKLKTLLIAALVFSANVIATPTKVWAQSYGQKPEPVMLAQES